MTKRWMAGTVCALAVTGGAARGAEPEHVTDRPDQTESSKVVPAASAQLETGVLRGGDDAGSSAALFGTLLRIGLGHGWEARLGHAGYLMEDPDEGERREGWGDGELGAKVRLLDEAGWRPEVALLGGVSLPTGGEEFSSERADPSFRFSLSHTLTDRLSLGYNLGGEWTSETDERGDRDRSGALIYTLSLGASLTEAVGAFVEIYGEDPAQTGDVHRLDGGFTFALTDTFQLDVSGGVGLGDVSDEWFAGAGLSKRWPK